MNGKKIKVLFLIPTLTSGGAERVIINLLRFLDRSRFSLILAVVNLKSAVFLDDLPDDILLIDLKCSRVRFSFFKIIHLIWQLRPDVIFSTLGHLNLMMAIMRPCLPKNICFLGRETTIISESIQDSPYAHYWRWAYDVFYRRFDKIICQSNYMRSDLITSFGISSNKLVVINNPIDIDRIRHLAAESLNKENLENKSSMSNLHSHKIINLVSAGRLVKVKGFDILIDALAMCANLNFCLTILGEGPMKDELQTQANNRGVAGRVCFAGFQKNPFPFFAQADAFVLSSRYEGFPNVVLEALACGTPVISVPAVGGVKEILEGIEDCLIADNITAKGLAEAFSRFEFNKRILPNVVERFAIDRIVKSYEDLFVLKRQNH